MPERTVLPEQQALMERLGHDFNDPALLIRALTHRSWANEQGGGVRDYERLEFLGDAVVELVLSEELFRRNPDQPEGELTRARAALVNEQALARFARELDIPPALRLGKGEEGTGGRDKDSILCDAFESVLGALFLDAGYDRCAFLIISLLGEALEGEGATRDWKSRLQALVQEGGGPTPRYRTVSTSGPDHDKRFEVALVVDGVEVCRGAGRSKKDASQDAARQAIEEGLTD